MSAKTVPASELIIGLQCGGSDALSGITANPALGIAGDILVRHGGTVILSETPEIFGAEHLLTRRAESPKLHKNYWIALPGGKITPRATILN